MGVTLGVAGAFATTQLLGGLLYGVTTTDPLTFAAVPLLLVAVALLASLAAGRARTRVHPMSALRGE